MNGSKQKENTTHAFTIGINEVGLLPKLTSMPSESVWKDLKKMGITSVELCAAFDGNERAVRRGDEIEFAYTGGKGKGMPRGKAAFERIAGVRQAGLEVVSMHLMFCEAYPEYIREALPFLQQLHGMGVEQFVVSCSFDSVDMVQAYLPHLQYTAGELCKEGAVLCYHNHQKDCEKLENGMTPLEMVLKIPEIMIQFDIGWAWYGGMDALAFMKAHGDRIASLHLKDLTADARERTDRGRFTAIGSGAVNTAECLALANVCRLTPNRLILDQDASVGDILEDTASGVRFVRACLNV